MLILLHKTSWLTDVGIMRFGGYVSKTIVGQRNIRALHRNAIDVDVSSFLLKRSPVFAEQWHPTKNRTLSPADVTASSSNEIWWL
jgi:Probable Zinc-ribbon domain